MAKRPMTVVIALIMLALGLAAVAWIDGGLEEQRAIETPVTLPAVPQGTGA